MSSSAILTVRTLQALIVIVTCLLLTTVSSAALAQYRFTDIQPGLEYQDTILNKPNLDDHTDRSWTTILSSLAIDQIATDPIAHATSVHHHKHSGIPSPREEPTMGALDTPPHNNTLSFRLPLLTHPNDDLVGGQVMIRLSEATTCFQPELVKKKNGRILTTFNQPKLLDVGARVLGDCDYERKFLANSTAEDDDAPSLLFVVSAEDCEDEVRYVVVCRQYNTVGEVDRNSETTAKVGETNWDGQLAWWFHKQPDMAFQ